MTENRERPVLSIEGLRMRFGGVDALLGVDFVTRPGTIMGIIGPNGAGKTTVFNLITGVYRPTEGSIKLGGRELVGLAPHRIAQLGLTRTFQTVRVFGAMTVLENVMIGRHPRTNSGFLAALFKPPWERREEKRIREDAMHELDFVGLSDRWDQRCDTLPLGHLRLVEIARAMATAPHYLLLDEPAAGLNSTETLSLAALFRKICERGVTPVVVDHDMDLVMDVCDRIMVLNYGGKIAEGAPREIQNNTEVIAAYLGEGAFEQRGPARPEAKSRDGATE